MINTNSAQLIPVAVRSEAWVCGRSLAGIKGTIPPGHVRLSLANVVCCEVQVSVTGRSRVQRSPTDCVCVCVCVTACDRVKLTLYT